jgi:hypothetical protein
MDIFPNNNEELDAQQNEEIHPIGFPDISTP